MSIIANLGNIINEKNQSSELWQAQRQADRENTNAMQDAGIVQITSDPDAYLRYLNCQADNPSYSAGNVALVMVQDQDATIFGTKDRWKSLMRSVSPTEEKNGVKIYTRSSFGKGYVLTDVYDVRQTRGANQRSPLARASRSWGDVRARPEMRLTVRFILWKMEVLNVYEKTTFYHSVGPTAAGRWYAHFLQAPRRAKRSCLHGY